MSKHFAKAKWLGKLKDGEGKVKLESTGYEAGYSFTSRFEASGKGTSPEELIGAAHAGCFSMAFSLGLEKAGFDPEEIETKAEVRLEKVDNNHSITKIVLRTKAKVKDISHDKFMEIANDAKEGCPVSRALTAVDIALEAELTE